MKNFWSKNKGTILILIIVILGFWAYNKFFTTPDDVLEDDGGEIVGEDVLRLVDNLDTIKLKADVFEKQSFKSLVDITANIPPQPAGRENPFAPIGQSNLPNPVVFEE